MLLYMDTSNVFVKGTVGSLNQVNLRVSMELKLTDIKNNLKEQSFVELDSSQRISKIQKHQVDGHIGF